MRVTLVLLTLFLCPAGVSAQENPAHARLKDAGVDDALRRRVLEAVDRGVTFLLAQQKHNGSVDHRSHAEGTTALVALALHHAGTPTALQGMRKAVSYLMSKRQRRGGAVGRDVYTTAITIMLLQSARLHRDRAAALTKDLIRGLRKESGWWGYSCGSGTKPRGANLSTTQFGALGIWAGKRFGAALPGKPWERHLTGLLRTQTRGGSWAYMPNKNQNGYPNGTAMGLGNLLLAEKALAPMLAQNPKLAQKVAEAKAKALAVLAEQAPLILEGSVVRGMWHYYGMYALEKACLFAGIERIGSIPWYPVGAEILLQSQDKDGGWRFSRTGFPPEVAARLRKAPDPVSTAFAILFLLRTPQSHQVTTPSDAEIARRKREREEGRKEAGPGKTAGGLPTGPVRLDEAWLSLVRARILIFDSRVELARRLKALDRLGLTYNLTAPPRQRPGQDSEAAAQAKLDFLRDRKIWRQRAEATLLRVVQHQGAEEEPADRTALLLRTLRWIGETRTDVGASLNNALTPLLKAKEPNVEVLQAAGRALVKLNHASTLQWIRLSVLNSRAEPRDIERSLFGLRVVAGFRKVPGYLRHAMVERLLDLYGETGRLANPKKPRAGKKAEQARVLWPRVREPLLAALHAMARDPKTGAPIHAGRPVTTLGQFKSWFKKHGDASKPPWTD